MVKFAVAKMLRTYRYHFLFIPSLNGEVTTGTRTAEFLDELSFLRELNSWNLASAGKWQYWWDGTPPVKHGENHAKT